MIPLTTSISRPDEVFGRDRYTPEEILGLPPEQLKTFVFTGKPLVFKAGSAQILGEFDLRDNRVPVGVQRDKVNPI